MVYNLTSITDNSTSIVGFVQSINDTLMFGWLGTMILISFFIILITSFYFKTNDVSKSLSGSSFIIFVLAVFLRALSFIDPLTLYITLIISGLTIAFTWKK